MTNIPMTRGARALELLIFRVLPCLAVVGGVIVCLYWFASCRDTVAARGDLSGAWVAAQSFVEQRLKSPASAKFEFGAAHDGAVRLVGDRIYSVESYVDSQNSFGATIRQKFRLQVKSGPGGEWQLVNGEINFY